MIDWFKHIQELKLDGEIGLFEQQFAKFIANQEINPDNLLISCAVLVASDQLSGNICTDLNELENSVLASKLKLKTKNPDEIKTTLANSLSVGTPGDFKPIILENNKLYLHKYWSYEEEITKWLKAKANKQDHRLSESEINQIESLFPESVNEFDYQKLATQMALIKELLIISGGPGTGKTYTVKKILEAFLEKDTKLKIALAAPTGKAAERLNESIREVFPDLEAVTVHRLLGARRNGEFKHGTDNKLLHDIVIIDEASMLDIRLWIGLVRSLKDNCKLILLGDKDQLASVEAGSVLGDICHKSDAKFSKLSLNQLDSEVQLIENSSKNALNDNIVLLDKSYRVTSDSGISQWGKAINEQNVEGFFKLTEEFHQIRAATPSDRILVELIDKYIDEIISGEFKTQFLSSNRKGVFGTMKLNSRIETLIKSKLDVPPNHEWYLSRRIIATKNDFSLGIKNGEIGFCDSVEDGEYFVSFESSKRVSASQLKYYDLAYSITIHKSQGSEFNDVCLFLSDSFNPVLSKELLYTGVTRAKENALVIGRRGLIEQVILNEIRRTSSIPEKLKTEFK